MLNKKRDRFFWESAQMNNRTYLYYYNRLMELAISMFEWKNLPETIDPRFLELTLFADGKALYFNDDVMGDLALQMTYGGSFNVYRIPKDRRAYAVNGYNRSFNETNSVIIFNNLIHTNTMCDMEMYARRLYNIERTIDVNVNAQKTPVLVQATESQRLTMKNLYKEYEGNEPFIFGDKNLDINGMKVLKTDAPFVADKLMQLKFQIWNEAMTYLGISNVNMHKKERLLNDEVTRNMGSTVASRYSRLEARKQACKEINKMFNLDIDVEYREDVQVIADMTNDPLISDEEVMNNE